MLDIQVESKIYEDLPEMNRCFAECRGAILTIDHATSDSDPAEFMFKNMAEVEQFCDWLRETCEQEFYLKACNANRDKRSEKYRNGAGYRCKLYEDALFIRNYCLDLGRDEFEIGNCSRGREDKVFRALARLRAEHLTEDVKSRYGTVVKILDGELREEFRGRYD